jgi:hypothetical protein
MENEDINIRCEEFVRVILSNLRSNAAKGNFTVQINCFKAGDSPKLIDGTSRDLEVSKRIEKLFAGKGYSVTTIKDYNYKGEELDTYLLQITVLAPTY